eukprot:1149338-Prymnesium_polylepis.1
MLKAKSTHSNPYVAQALKARHPSISPTIPACTVASSGAAERPERTAGTGQRSLRLHGRRAGRMVRSLVISP